jgi:hypothetical protein
VGLEAICSATWAGQSSHGKAQLETDYLLFRGDFRLKVLFSSLKEVRADNGTLSLKFKGGPATLHLGGAAEKWAEKILKPPSLLQKLGIKPGVTVALAGEFEAAFTGEVLQYVSRVDSSNVVFLPAESLADLDRLTEITDQMPTSAALWIVYPKGKREIRETDVISRGRAASLTDVKVVSFSATHTGLKFVRPKTARKK